MASILPYHTEMLILPLSEKEVRERLYKAVYPLSHHQPMASGKDAGDFLFNGYVQKGRFRISRRIRHANTFLPLVKGVVEETRNGCIIHLRANLFPSTKGFLWFWLAVSTLIAIIFLYQAAYYKASLAALSAVFCLLITRLSFRRALRDTRNTLLPVFS